MEPFVYLYLGLAAALLGWFALWTKLLATRRDIPEADMLRYALFCLFASVAIFGLASYGLEAAKLTEEQHILGLFGITDWRQLTDSQMSGFESTFLSRADRPLLLRMFGAQTFSVFVKFFVPVILAAIGVWALEKFLDRRIKVI